MKGLVNIFILNYIGNLFQVSNQTNLGEKEEDIINRLAKVIEQIIGHEQAARETLLEKKRTMLIDQVGRAYGILRNAGALAEELAAKTQRGKARRVAGRYRARQTAHVPDAEHVPGTSGARWQR